MDATGMSRRGDLRIIKKDTNGLKLAFLSINDVDMKMDREKVQKILEMLENESYIVTLNIHWGDEYKK